MRVAVIGPLNSGIGRFQDREEIFNTNFTPLRLGHELEVLYNLTSSPVLDLRKVVKF